MASPNCEVREGVGAFGATTEGVNVAANATISVRLASTTDVVTWKLQVVGTDELSTAPVLTGVNAETHIVATPGTIVTFTYPNDTGRALLLQSTVIGGGTTTTKFAIFSLINGARVGAAGETREGNLTFGWASKVNPLLRSMAVAVEPLTEGAVFTASPLIERTMTNLMSTRVDVADTPSVTITLAQGRRRAIPAATQHNAITLSNTGAVAGDTITLDRTATNYRRNRVNRADGTQIFVIGGPGTFVAEFDGTHWRRLSSDRNNGSRKLSPYDFGAIGDGVANDTAAIQAMFDSLAVAQGWQGFCGQIEIPQGEYKITAPIQITGDGFKSLRVTGDVGGSTGFQGTRFTWAGGVGGGVVLTGSPTLTYAAGANTITRSGGDWLVEGFVVGQVVTSHNCANPLNNTTGTILALTSTVMTVGCALQNETVVTLAMVGSPTLTFAANVHGGELGDTITRSTGSWVTDGFTAGKFITITGSASNNHIIDAYVASVTATVLTLHGLSVAPEVTSSATVTAPVMIARAVAMFHCTAMQGASWEHLEIRQEGTADYGFLLDYTPALGGCQSVTFNRMSFYYPRNAAGACGIALGPDGAGPYAGYQVSEIGFRDIYVMGYPVGVGYPALSASYLASGVRTRTNGNTKNFRFDGCGFGFVQRGIDWARSSGQLTVMACIFAGCSVDVWAAEGTATLIGCESERSGRLCEGGIGGGTGTMTIIGCDWNGSTQPIDTVVNYGGSLSIRGSTFINGRVQHLFTVDAGTDTFTATDHLMPNGTPHCVFQGAGGILPVPLRERVTYYVVNRTAHTYQLSLTLGGAPIDILTNGTPQTWAFSPSKIAVGNTLNTGNTSASLDSFGNWFFGASEAVWVVDGSNNLPMEGEAAASYKSNVSSRADTGGSGGALVKLAQIQGVASAIGNNGSYTAFSEGIVDKITAGHIGDGWHEYVVKPKHLITAGSIIQIYIYLPARTFLHRMLFDTTVAFDGIATFTAQAWYTAGDDLILTHSIKTVGCKGLLDVERGSLFTDAAVPHGQGFIPAAGWAAQWPISIQLTGSGALGSGAASNLTQGNLRILLRTERAP